MSLPRTGEKGEKQDSISSLVSLRSMLPCALSSQALCLRRSRGAVGSLPAQGRGPVGSGLEEAARQSWGSAGSWAKWSGFLFLTPSLCCVICLPSLVPTFPI